MDTDDSFKNTTVPQNQSHSSDTTKSTNNGISPPALSDDSDIEPDLVSHIKHNTETSLSALKEVMKTEEVLSNGSFFQRYFQNHSNSLPSRLAVTSRRLSQCREEDEKEEDDEEKKNQVPSNSDISAMCGSDKSLSESSTSSKTSVIDTVSGPTHKFVITKTKQLPSEPTSSVQEESTTQEEPAKKQPSEAAKIFANRKQYRQANTVHAIGHDSGRPPVYSIFRSPLSSPHYDTKFFDSSLIEMKSQTSSSSTIDNSGSVEDIWVKRSGNDKKRELGSQPLPTTNTEDVDALPRPRSGTWSAKSDVKKEKHKSKDKKSSGKDSSKKEKTSGSRSGSTSRSSSLERRKSEDITSPKKAGLAEGFRSRSNSDAGKKKGSAFMASVRNAMLHTGFIHVKTKAPKDGSAHPVRDNTDSSDTRYYHTVTAAASSTRGTMTKVMDIFRNKPTFQSEEEIRREAKEKEERKEERRREERREEKRREEKREEKRRKEKEKNVAFGHGRPKGPRDGSAHPVRDGSDNQYYHTVTAASSNRSPMTKVMDIFRNRSHASVPPEERRKEKSIPAFEKISIINKDSKHNETTTSRTNIPPDIELHIMFPSLDFKTRDPEEDQQV